MSLPFRMRIASSRMRAASRSEANASLRRAGYHVEHGFFSPERCGDLLRRVADFRREHDAPLVERVERRRSLRYRVIDGTAVRRWLPSIWALQFELRPRAESLWGGPLAPWGDERVAVNVNITPPGGEYRWHYDRNPVTLILYLNSVAGGEVELYPNYRLRCGGPLAPLQEGLDRMLGLPLVRRALGTRVVIPPGPGMLLAMRGDRCLHSVRTVRGSEERINVVVSYGAGGAAHVRNRSLDTYLYTTEMVAGAGRDPNYPRRAP